MGPRRSESIPQDELFRNRLENLIDQRHELVRLAALIDWEVFDREWGSLFSQTRAPAIAPRLIAGLHYLKHLYKLFDEVVVPRWVENAYHQCLCGETYFQHQVPIHPTSMTRWRKRMGEEGFEWLLTQTIEAGRETGSSGGREGRAHPGGIGRAVRCSPQSDSGLEEASSGRR